MKIFIALLVIFVSGCHDYQSVARMCVDYRTSDQSCASNFFIGGNTAITAKHWMEESLDGEIRLPRWGADIRTSDYTMIRDRDVSIVRFDKEVVDDYFEICDSVEFGNKIEFVGVLDIDGDLEIRDGTLVSRYRNTSSLFIDGNSKSGFSGGPVVDIERQCVVAVISGKTDSKIVAVDITDLSINDVI